MIKDDSCYIYYGTEPYKVNGNKVLTEGEDDWEVNFNFKIEGNTLTTWSSVRCDGNFNEICPDTSILVRSTIKTDTLAICTEFDDSKTTKIFQAFIEPVIKQFAKK